MAISKRASCKHLTHKYASFNGCTLDEALVIVGIYILLSVVLNSCLAMVLKSYLASFMGAFLLGSLVFIPLVFFCLKKTTQKLGRIRKGRPAGFITFTVSLFMHETFGMKIPYLTRNGQWSTRRGV